MVVKKEQIKLEEVTYFKLNNMVNIPTINGEIQLDKDKEAVKAFFLENINPRTVFFHDLEEKIDYLTEQGFIEEDFLMDYNLSFIKKLFKHLYNKRFRFKSFMGAYKFYNQYALKSFDGKYILERYEDRIAFASLYIAGGDEELAWNLADEHIEQRFQLATPTFLNAGKTARGELVSCFRGHTLINTRTGLVPIKDIRVGDEVLTGKKRYKKVTGVHKRLNEEGFVTLDLVGTSQDLEATPEHPVLVYRNIQKQSKQPLNKVIDGDGDSPNLYWVSIKDVQVGDLIAKTFDKGSREDEFIELKDYLDSDTNYELLENGKLGVKTIDKKSNKYKGNDISEQTKQFKNVIELNESFGRLIGYYLAEGYVHVNRTDTTEAVKGVKFTINSKDDYILEDLKDIITTQLGTTWVENVNNDGSTNISVWSKGLGEVFHNLLGSGYDKKLISDVLYQQTNKDFIRGIIVGVCRGDGSTSVTSHILEMSNIPLMKQIETLLFRLSIIGYYTEPYKGEGSPTGRLSIPTNTPKQESFIRYIGKDVYKLNSKSYSDKYSMWLDGYPLFKVKSTTYAESESVDVYNLEVEDDHTYAVEGILVHNCFLLDIQDNMESIGRAVNSALQLSKKGGGVGGAK